jgi:hypothetical protein
VVVLGKNEGGQMAGRRSRRVVDSMTDTSMGAGITQGRQPGMSMGEAEEGDEKA